MSSSSLSSSTPPVSFTGLVSGLDTNSIIQKLLAVETQPLTLLQQQQAQMQQTQQIWQGIGTQLSSLQTTMTNLMGGSGSLSSMLATTTPPTGGTAAISAKASPGATAASYQVTVYNLATPTTVSSSSALGQAVNQTAALASAGFATAPTTGTFTINGKQITIDSSTTLNSGADSIVSLINGSGAGVTASIVNDPSGRQNLLQLTSNASITLGAGGDTSNFLAAAGLSSAVQQNNSGTYTITSSGELGVAQTGVALQNANLTTSLNNTTGSFSINGVSFSWNSAVDTISSLLSQVNSSSAGVTASYDSFTDTITLSANNGNSTPITLQDTQGNFLSAMNLLGATQTLGTPATYSISGINNGQKLSSPTNTVQGVIPNVTLTLQAQSPTNQPTTLTIAPDIQTATSAVQAFITAYNSIQDTLSKDTAASPANDGTNNVNAGPLTGDLNAESLQQQLDTIINNQFVTADGQHISLADLGITTGAPTANPGVPTYDLQLDTSKLQSALQSNPSIITALMGNTTSLSTQNASIIGQLNSYLNSWTDPVSGNIQSENQDLTSELQDNSSEQQYWQNYITQRTQQLQTYFSNMETALSQLQAQTQALTALGNFTAPTTSSSSKSTSSSSSGG